MLNGKEGMRLLNNSGGERRSLVLLHFSSGAEAKPLEAMMRAITGFLFPSLQKLRCFMNGLYAVVLKRVEKRSLERPCASYLFGFTTWLNGFCGYFENCLTGYEKS